MYNCQIRLILKLSPTCFPTPQDTEYVVLVVEAAAKQLAIRRPCMCKGDKDYPSFCPQLVGQPSQVAKLDSTERPAVTSVLGGTLLMSDLDFLVHGRASSGASTPSTSGEWS